MFYGDFSFLVSLFRWIFRLQLCLKQIYPKNKGYTCKCYDKGFNAVTWYNELDILFWYKLFYSICITLMFIYLYMSIQAYITYVIYDLSVLRVIQNIQILGFLQGDKLFMTSS